MQKLVVFTEKEFKEIQEWIIKNVIDSTNKPYGCKFISKETNKELNSDQMYGLLIDPVRSAFFRRSWKGV